MFWTERGCTKCQPPTTRALSQVGGKAVNFLITLQNHRYVNLVAEMQMMSLRHPFLFFSLLRRLCFSSSPRQRGRCGRGGACSSRICGKAVNFLITLQNLHPEPRMVQSGVRTPNVVFFFYFFGIGVSFVLDGAWLHEVPAPDNAGVVASWRQSRQLFNHAPKPSLCQSCSRNANDVLATSVFIFFAVTAAML